jgi:chloramphenicol 3-O-phosphotransferase
MALGACMAGRASVLAGIPVYLVGMRMPDNESMNLRLHAESMFLVAAVRV